jgi:hypothetical protein
MINFLDNFSNLLNQYEGNIFKSPIFYIVLVIILIIIGVILYFVFFSCNEINIDFLSGKGNTIKNCLDKRKKEINKSLELKIFNKILPKNIKKDKIIKLNRQRLFGNKKLIKNYKKKSSIFKSVLNFN